MSKGREPLYLRPGMNEAELFQQFNARSPYYRHIAARLVHISTAPNKQFTQGFDVSGRTGYCARAMQASVGDLMVIEKRAVFVQALEDEFAAEMDPSMDRCAIMPAGPDPGLGYDEFASLILCCEQGAQLLAGNFTNWMRRATGWGIPGSIFGMTLGPSNHPFKDFAINNHRVGESDPAKVMTELAHPIAQAVHAEMVKLLTTELGFSQDAVWPPAGKLTDPDEIARICEEAGWKNLSVTEEHFRVPGHQIHLYQQNAWTMYFRFWTEEQCSTEKRIDLLTRAVEAVRARPEYDDWCAIDAYHPVAFYIATRG